jgi:hypothetical protein
MNPSRFSLFACLLISLLCGACQQTQHVFDLQRTQRTFDAASRQDNLAALGQSVPSGYGQVLSQLTDETISALPDPRLKANAWMMRGVSEWRTGDYLKAQASAANGLQAGPESGSRDHLLLLMLPALAIDGQIFDAWKKAGQSFTLAQYNSVAANDYPVALKKLRSLSGEFTAKTDADTQDLLAFHQWRLFLNWDRMINHLAADETMQDAAAESAASHFGGISLAKQARAARDSIRTDSTYGKLIASRPNGTP